VIIKKKENTVLEIKYHAGEEQGSTEYINQIQLCPGPKVFHFFSSFLFFISTDKLTASHLDVSCP